MRTRYRNDLRVVGDRSGTHAIEVTGLSKEFRIPREKKLTLYQHITSLLAGHGHAYDTFRALQDISFTVEHSETFGIIGPNGSGKSTLLKLLAGVIYADTGKIGINGRIAPFLELGVGFHPELTARDNVFLYGAVLGLPLKKIRERYEEIMDFAELKRFENMKLRHLSSGMQVRLAFSTAIQSDPDILLVDEVLAVGDEAFKRKCADKVDEFRKEGKTILLVSHDMDLIRDLCSRTMFIQKGYIKALDQTEKVIDDYMETVK
ncbi:lipopolysaccharide transport system ATP-binding protein [Methanolinea mesophila]|uniref:ABC transporter ATP-binding protein n=1 Tax=Methanolinea mesophila TaxID=547055 RepID=UPI001AE3D9C6|nr:ABC transporter ATP-binding protein [Methanolinea mesophila]MBP1928322.1 lipopolysaccharide transport system ATP-binding protein [Methanolinea mesophila]